MAPASKTKGEIHDSPALAELFSTLTDEGPPVRVLDLGPALPVNLDFYSTFAGGLRIAHLLRNEDLEKLRDPDTNAFVSILGRLPANDEAPFDLILIWDLLDFLTAEQPSLLAHHLAAVSERGARIHAMVSSTDRMPSEPSRYEIAGRGRLIYRPTTDRTTLAPNPPPAQVERWLDPFRVTRSFILRHGVREFLGVLD